MKRLQYIDFFFEKNVGLCEPYFYVYASSTKVNECNQSEAHQNKAILMINIKSMHANCWSAI